MSRRTPAEIKRGYDRLQRRKRHVAAFDGMVLSPFSGAGNDRITRALSEVSA